MTNPQYSDWSSDPVPIKRQSYSLIKVNAWADDDNKNQIDQKKTSIAWCFKCCIIGSLLAGIGLAFVLTFWLTSKTTATGTLIVTTSSSGSSSSLSVSTSIVTSSNTPSTTKSPSSTAASTSTSSPTSPSTSISTAASTPSSVSISSTRGAYNGYDDIFISCSIPLTNVTIQITVSKTVGATYNGAFTTFSGGLINQYYIDNGTDIIFTWTIVSGQTINCVSSTFHIEAHYNLFGISQPNNVDSYTTIIETSNGTTTVNSGYF
ncbi:unnamed protein product [Adineta steineri]|uniref:Uncharacterized protein n=1 Tax=Adineta steineri TaxID=433720 RepID=A0A814W1I3_9BILA|nr:unnamed protein product [Adineta steineri]CAF1453252.1 unnamed protein product [Adineta steineri]